MKISEEIFGKMVDLGLVQQNPGKMVILVPKKYVTWHMCIDYRDLNKISVKNIYPLPWIDELIDSLKGAKFFMKLNLKSGYHQIPIKSIDVWKMTLKTKEGLFEWLVTPFELTNAPTTFMRYMDNLLQPFINKRAIVYLDDILIFSQSWEVHVRKLRQVFDTL